ncbi:penicillin-binding protein 2 [Parabacteroides sp. 52]|uniref:penicillin-binding protein 2 n=1 Tax=unclassified Parabacteroides TaxID=2649774 RepID=UPI0013D1583E|nr:penicillin-binding protein 2 [Parabacteroides sp. PM5-20]MDH6534606.1 penicillin-binding protein 2 [Parabacteroides sp. PM5-20]NDV55161.1 penicillin-binding protein 2 [Parabacteroides sp. 52]
MEKNNKYTLENRRFIIGGAVILMIFVFIVRLFFLQVVDNDYKAWADSNAFLKKTIYPSRGMIYDRNGKLLVYNQPTYDVMMIMREVQPFDTLDFCNILGINKELFDKRIEEIKNRRLNPGYSSYVPQLFMHQLSAQEYGILQEKLYKFPGFYIQSRTIREYEYPYAAHVLGDIGKVNKKDMEEDSYYSQEDYTGRSGVERSYEKILRGEKGTEILLRDAHGRIKGRYDEGAYDVTPESGKNISLSIDIELQAYGEYLMQNKKGSIVMIEPQTGEILCMVSAPSYDPRLLVGRQRGSNHIELEKDPHNPLLDRSVMGRYPPGSTFKPAQGLIFLQENVITPQTLYSCSYGYTYNSRGGKPKPACHGHASPLGLIPALATSCNSYFCWGLHEMLDNRHRYQTIQEGFEVWKNHIVSMGYGYKLGVDLPGENRGFIPNSAFYDKWNRGRWNSSTIISTAIGQGEITATPVQMCNLAATIANRGYFITPHVVREIEDMALDTLYTNKKYPTIDPKYYKDVAEGMLAAVQYGTCWAAAIPGIQVCGKTGTAENPHGKDHSAFMGFAPYENPKVAIVVYVENGGWGANYGVPIGKLMMEKYLTGTLSENSKYTEYTMVNSSTLRNVF